MSYVTEKYFYSVVKLHHLLFILAVFIANVAVSDHYYGGYFYYQTIGDKKVKVSLVSFTDHHNDQSDRDSVKFHWGDGTTSFLLRENNEGKGEELYEGTQKNVYVGEHTYTKNANYQLYFSDNYRVFDIRNMALGKSGVTHLRFDGVVPVQDTNTYCKNNTPLPLANPYFYGKEGQNFELNFAYYDQEGDSMDFKLTSCKGSNGKAAEGYAIPDGVSINPKTGQFQWESPLQGKYSFAFEVEEYRKGELLGKSSTDFTLFISHNDYHSLNTGSFLNTSGSVNNLYTFTQAGTKEFTLSYTHPQADSITCQVISPFKNHPHFELSRKNTASSTTFNDTISLSYTGNYAYQGHQTVLWEFTAHLGKDSLVKEVYPIGIAVINNTDWDCEVPDISIIEELAPTIPSLTISPSYFDDHVYINVGSQYENIQLYVFDIRGRLIRSYFQLTSATVKLELSGLSSAMYLLQVVENDKIIHTGKMIKK